MPTTKKRCTRLWASYQLTGEPVAVLAAVARSLDPEHPDAEAAYFGLSVDEEDDNTTGSHFTDREIGVHLVPVRRGFLLVLTGEADGLTAPLITPPNIAGAEAYGWGSIVGTEAQACNAGRKHYAANGARYASIPCPPEA